MNARTPQWPVNGVLMALNSGYLGYIISGWLGGRSGLGFKVYPSSRNQKIRTSLFSCPKPKGQETPALHNHHRSMIQLPGVHYIS